MREASCDLTSWRTKASGTGLSLPAPAKMIESHGTLALYEVFEVRCCQDDRIKIRVRDCEADRAEGRVLLLHRPSGVP